MRRIIVIVAAFALAGCGPKKTETMRQPAEAGQSEQTAAASISYNPDELDSLVQSLETKAQELPGVGAAAHREGMHAFFDDVAKVLPALEGPEQSGAFRQQLRTIESARDRLAPDAGAAAVEPAIDTGLRAASAALTRIGRDEDVSGQTLADLLKKLDAKVDELDRVRAVGRPYIAADAGRLIAQVARQMADRIAGRATDTPTTEPAAPEPAVVEPPPAQPPAEPPPAEPAPTEPAPTEPAPADAAPPTDPAPAEASPSEPPSETPPADEKPAEPAPEPAAEPAPAEESNK